MPANDNEEPGRMRFRRAWQMLWAAWHMSRAVKHLRKLGEFGLAIEIQEVAMRLPVPKTNSKRPK